MVCLARKTEVRKTLRESIESRSMPLLSGCQLILELVESLFAGAGCCRRLTSGDRLPRHRDRCEDARDQWKDERSVTKQLSDVIPFRRILRRVPGTYPS
jgi:hypothetical protein